MNIGIRARLNVLVVAAILPLLCLAGIFLWERLSDDDAQLRRDARNAAQLGAARIDDYLNHMNLFLGHVGRNLSGDPADTEKNDAILRAARADLPDYANNLLLFDLQGLNRTIKLMN